MLPCLPQGAKTDARWSWLKQIPSIADLLHNRLQSKATHSYPQLLPVVSCRFAFNKTPGPKKHRASARNHRDALAKDRVELHPQLVYFGHHHCDHSTALSWVWPRWDQRPPFRTWMRGRKIYSLDRTIHLLVKPGKPGKNSAFRWRFSSQNWPYQHTTGVLVKMFPTLACGIFPPKSHGLFSICSIFSYIFHPSQHQSTTFSSFSTLPRGS